MELRRDFRDSEHWNNLARERGIRLPRWEESASGGNIREWMIKLGMTHKAFVEWMGYEPDAFQGHNENWPLRAWVGLALEELSQR